MHRYVNRLEVTPERPYDTGLDGKLDSMYHSLDSHLAPPNSARTAWTTSTIAAELITRSSLAPPGLARIPKTYTRHCQLFERGACPPCFVLGDTARQRPWCEGVCIPRVTLRVPLSLDVLLQVVDNLLDVILAVDNDRLQAELLGGVLPMPTPMIVYFFLRHTSTSLRNMSISSP